MASLWKRSESKYWVACYTDAHGRQLKRSTRTADRAQAEKIAREFEATAQGQRTATQVMQTVLDLHQKATGQKIDLLNVRDFVNDWLRGKKAENAPATYAAYKGVCDEFVKHLGIHADRPLLHVTTEQVRDFWLTVGTSRHRNTARQYLKCLRMVFRSAHERRLIPENPTDSLKTTKAKTVVAESARRPFTLAEVRAVYDAADSEWRSLLIFGFYSGGRLADMATLKWENVDLLRNELNFTSRKTGKKVDLPLAPALRRHVESLSKGGQDDPLHPRACSMVTSERSASALSNQFAAILVRAGLRKSASHESKGKGRNVRRERERLSFHSLRHTLRTCLQDANVPLRVSMGYLGHSDISTSHSYAHVGKSALEDAANSLPDLILTSE